MPPPFRADHVGSLLRPPELKRAFREQRDGTLGDDEFRRVQDEAIRRAVELQESVGLRSVTDGEFRRASYWAHFVAAVDGLDVKEALFQFRDESGERMAFTAPHVCRPVKRVRAISAEEFRFLRAVTRQTPKITLPSPSTLHFWRGPAAIELEAYASVEEFFADLAGVYRTEIAELARLGATYLQLDEVALAMLCDPEVRSAVAARGEDPERLVDRYVDAINQALEGRPRGVTVAMHLCRGNYKGRWMGAGGYEAVAERAFGRARVDALFLEFDSPRAGDFAPLRHVAKDKRVVLGLVSSKTPVLEKKADLLRRIEAASRIVGVERLGLSPQCGFASTAAGNPLSEDDERRKLALVVDVARQVWGEA
jgi:5-methyltetrahydropteroyltriglutamate--homocysteine methyltransferase